MQAPHADPSQLFIELGCAIIGLAVLARIANRYRFSAIPLYLLAGLAFGNGGLSPLHLSENFIHTGAEIGVLLLLFMLGLEYTGQQLTEQLRTGLAAGIFDLVLNFPPGLIAGWLLGWKTLPAVLLGGVTYISSSGIVAKLWADLGRLRSPETAPILSVLVLEDLGMAVYLSIAGALLAGSGQRTVAVSVLLAVAVVFLVLFVAVRYGRRISHFAAHQSDEIILLTVLGVVLLVSGVAQQFHVSAAIAAFLVGIAVSGPIADQSHRLFAPLRDLFAATFFFFFGLQIDPAALPRALPVAAVLGVITALTKVATGYWAARNVHTDGNPEARRRLRIRAGIALIARGEFSIVIAGLGARLEPELGPLAAAYVLFMAILGPLAARIST